MMRLVTCGMQGAKHRWMLDDFRRTQTLHRHTQRSVWFGSVSIAAHAAVGFWVQERDRKFSPLAQANAIKKNICFKRS